VITLLNAFFSSGFDKTTQKRAIESVWRGMLGITVTASVSAGLNHGFLREALIKLQPHTRPDVYNTTLAPQTRVVYVRTTVCNMRCFRFLRQIKQKRRKKQKAYLPMTFLVGE